jgi:hypothetical protein
MCADPSEGFRSHFKTQEGKYVSSTCAFAGAVMARITFVRLPGVTKLFFFFF